MTSGARMTSGVEESIPGGDESISEVEESIPEVASEPEGASDPPEDESGTGSPPSPAADASAKTRSP
jgi:hypothetical protein